MKKISRPYDQLPSPSKYLTVYTMPAPSNPFYSTPSSSTSANRNPAPAPPPRPSEPVSYGSLSDLTGGRAKPAPPPPMPPRNYDRTGGTGAAPPSYSYNHSSGSGSDGYSVAPMQGQGLVQGQGQGQEGRRLPPFSRPPIPAEPPRRNVAGAAGESVVFAFRRFPLSRG